MKKFQIYENLCKGSSNMHQFRLWQKNMSCDFFQKSCFMTWPIMPKIDILGIQAMMKAMMAISMAQIAATFSYLVYMGAYIYIYIQDSYYILLGVHTPTLNIPHKRVYYTSLSFSINLTSQSNIPQYNNHEKNSSQPLVF